MAKLTKPVIAVNIDGTVRVLNQDPNATHFNWYTRELLSYNITSPSYDVVVAGTNESTTALPNSSYTNRVYITESYRDIRKFTSFKLYESGSSAVDVTELYVTKISDFEYSISIPNVEHDYIITWGVGAITYTITSSLTNCVADKSDESYVGGTAVNIVITAATGYTFDSSLGGTIGLSVGEVDKTSEYMTRSSDNKKVTIAIPAIAAVGNIIYAAGAVEEIVQLATPTIAMNADGKTLEITDVENATSYDVYVDGTLKTNVASVPNTTTFDLSTLSDIADGVHTVTVKAKADGYIDSDASNAVNYTSGTPIPTDSILFAGETSDFTLKATNKTWDGTVEYSTDKNTWSTWDGSEIPSANKKLYLRGKNNTKFYTSEGVKFVLSAKAGCYGNINALLDYENPPTTLVASCYESMFEGCKSLTTAPELPATTLANYCYKNMFKGCSSLTTGPSILPATTLADYCYEEMFCICKSLTTAPTLPATTLAPYCYRIMFYGCKSLTTAPELPATTLANYCYNNMFYGCTSFTTAPELPAPILADYCYAGMFCLCTSLTTAPELPATSLRDNCYSSMFYGCTSLKISATQTEEYTTAWRIPSAGEISTGAMDWNMNMLRDTGGTFKDNPVLNTTYYGAW